MGLNISKGNMYGFIDRTWNPIKGKCFHDCSYCYMKEINQNQREEHLDTAELGINLTYDKYIFVGSSIDLFAKNISSDWIRRSLNKCYDTNNNLFGEVSKYFFQSKNPKRFLEFINHPIFEDSIICTTIETNRWYGEHMRKSPRIEDRALAMEKIAKMGFKTHITIEPIMDFDLDELLELIKRCNPIQVNIGKNTNDNVKLPHPQLDKLREFIIELRKVTNVEIKDNLRKKKINSIRHD